MTVTRTQIAEHIAEAWRVTPATRADLLDAAVSNQAPPAVLEMLHRLPEENYRQLRQLWRHLADVPVA